MGDVRGRGLKTRIGQPDGPPPGRPKGILIGKDRAKQLAKEAIVAEAMGRRPADFDGDALEYLTACYRGEITPDPLRMQAAAQALKFERPSLSAVAVKADVTQQLTTSDLDKRIMELLTVGRANALVK